MLNYRSVLAFLLRVLSSSRNIGYAPLVAIWVMAILLMTYMLATGSIVDSEAAQIAKEVREILAK